MSWIKDLPRELEAAGIEIKGVVHVGAHMGQEVPAYRKLNLDPIVLVEPQNHCVEHLRTLKGVHIIHRAIDNNVGFATLYCTKNDKKSSVLLPIETLDGQEVITRYLVHTIPLSDLEDWGADLLVIDAQGSEYDVLRSGSLTPWKVIIVETRERFQYDGQGTLAQVNHYLTSHGFVHKRTWQGRKSDIADHLYLHNSVIAKTEHAKRTARGSYRKKGGAA